MIKKNLFLNLIVVLAVFVTVRYSQGDIREGGKEYVISPDDILNITVYGEEDLSVSMRVSEDGTINYPLLGNIRAAGLTARQLEQQITDLLGQDYLVMPQVSVFIKEYAKVSILGKVRFPGSYQLKGNLVLTEAIALAGGFDPLANTSRVKITRTTGQKKETLEVDFDRIINKTAEDIGIKAGDVIMVEEYGQVSVIGQVRHPGPMQIKENLSMTQAIALAGGFTDEANISNVNIIRVSGAERETLVVDVSQILNKSAPDIEIEPNDTIIVEEYGRISVMGQVNRPGVYNLKRNLTVVEAISLAGGFTSVAAPNNTRVIRTEDGEKKIIIVPVTNITRGDSSRDIILKEGDTIVVPEAFF